MEGPYAIRRYPGDTAEPLSQLVSSEQSSAKGTDCSIISANNIVAYCETGEDENGTPTGNPSQRIRVALAHSKVGQMVVNFFGKYRRQSQLPIGVVTVGTRKGRQLLTRWLLEFLEENGQALDLPGSTQIPENYERSLNLVSTDGLETVSNGVYISPRAYLFTEDNHRGSPVVMWVIYVDENSLAELRLFAEMSATSVIQIGVKDLQLSSSQPINGNMEDELKRRFGDHLKRMCFLPATLPPNEQPVTLNDFQAYLQFIVDEVNARSPQERRGRSNLPNVVPIQDTEGEYRINYRMPTYPNTLSEGHWPVQTKLEASPTIEKVPKQEAYLEVKQWFDKLMDKNSLADIFNLLQGQGETSREILLLIEIFRPFMDQMYNMFDNYVCFHGPQDTGEMAQFLERGKGRAVLAFRLKRPLFDAHTGDIIERGLEQAFQTVGVLLREENNNIVRKEEALAEMVMGRLLEGYQNKMVLLAGSLDGSFKLLGVAHQNMTQQCIGILQDSLDYKGKLNFVMTEKSREVEHCLKKSLEEIIRRKSTETRRVKQIPTIKVTQPSPIKDQSNPTDKTVQECVQRYVALMRNGWSDVAPRPLEQQIEFHQQLLSECIHGVNTRNVCEEVSLRLNNYFIHVIESLAQLNEVGDSGAMDADDLSTPEPLCVHLTPHSIRVTGTTQNGKSRCLLFGPNGDNGPHLPPVLVLTTENQFFYGWEAIQWMRENPTTSRIRSRGGVMNYLNAAPVHAGMSSRILGDLFIHLNCHAERSFLENKQRYTRVVLLVPSWFTLIHRSRLREACKKAGLTQVYFLSEAPLAAHMILRRQSLVSKAVVVILAEGYVQVRLYQRKASGIQLVALAQEQCLQEDAILQSSIISTAYKAVCEQDSGGVQSPGRMQKLAGVAIYESSQWQPAYQKFLKLTPEILTEEAFGGEESLREDEDTLRTLMRIALQPYLILSLLCDRGIDFEVSGGVDGSFNEKRAEVTQNRQPILVEEQQGIDMKVQVRNDLRDKCNSIQRQIDGGSVSLGVLSEKLARGVLEGAEAVVQDVTATIEELNRQLEQIHDLIDNYNFSDDS